MHFGPLSSPDLSQGCGTSLGGLFLHFLIFPRVSLDNLTTLTVRHDLVQDLAQYIQEEMYHFVLGPDMMERVRPEIGTKREMHWCWLVLVGVGWCWLVLVESSSLVV